MAPLSETRVGLRGGACWDFRARCRHRELEGEEKRRRRTGGTDGAHARAHGEPFVGEPGKREGSYNATRAEREEEGGRRIGIGRGGVSGECPSTYTRSRRAG